MDLHQRIVHARKKKGFTQEQVAELTNVTVRTIQRIESGDSIPRTFTLKAIASVLEIPFEEFISDQIRDEKPSKQPLKPELLNHITEDRHFLQMFCLSCFSYLLIPLLHFLVPVWILKRSNEQNPKVIAFARRLIRVQVYWMVSLQLLILFSLAFNFISASYFQKSYLMNYMWLFLLMYILNAMIISAALIRIQKTDFSLQNLS
ncbi:helix-turn-helix domain-containing protein [Daejeonella oryzae]|uniref:helix-turn-helix domain-containing protein n=1 Tax=Daejeonella oryzae TaxID=1122943 RepID=UPI0004255DFE|nr:helix-turn-helix domain-containing protein [Daejeonella oryzae]